MVLGGCVAANPVRTTTPTRAAVTAPPPSVVAPPPAAPAEPPVDLSRVRYVVVLGAPENTAPGADALREQVRVAVLRELRGRPAVLVREGSFGAADASLAGGRAAMFSLHGGVQEYALVHAAAPSAAPERHHHHHHHRRHHHHPEPAAPPAGAAMRLRVRMSFVLLREPQHAMIGMLGSTAEVSGVDRSAPPESERLRLAPMAIDAATRGALSSLEQELATHANSP